MSKIFAAFFLIVAAVMLWQHMRYLNARRDNVLDRQSMMYSSESLHVATFFEVSEGEDVVEKLKQLRKETDGIDGVQWIYAGMAGVGIESKQIENGAWNAAILQQYPSRQVYESISSSDAYRKSLAAFPNHHSIGIRRPWLLNLAIPQLLLGLRFVDVLRGGWTVDDFVKDTQNPVPESTGGADGPGKLRELAAINPRAVLIFNFLKDGTAEQQAANKSYGLTMLTRMAALAHGPMHIGKTVTLDGDASFDTAVFVYYPGPVYMADMVESTFFRSIVGGKQPGDTLVVMTVPILDRL